MKAPCATLGRVKSPRTGRLVTVREVAKACGCSEQCARRRLKRAGIYFRTGHRGYTTKNDLKRVLPEVAAVLGRPAHEDVYLSTAEIAARLQVDTQKVRRWLKVTGAGRKRGGRIVATRETLREHAPQILQEIEGRTLLPRPVMGRLAELDPKMPASERRKERRKLVANGSMVKLGKHFVFVGHLSVPNFDTDSEVLGDLDDDP